MIKFKSNVFHKLLMLCYKPKTERSSALAQPALSFERVCPTWARKLRIGLDEQDVRTLAYDSKYCIVGEAWGYSGRHAGYYIAPLIPFIGCWKCVKFGREMGRIAKLHGQSCTSDLHPIIDNFLEHWNKRHRDISQFGQIEVVSQ
jgi:hypothetical protein